jgi:hypothetical protein
MSYKAGEIRHALMREIRLMRHMPIVHELTLPNGFISDVASVTKTGFVCDWEIKTSKADFLNDFKKSNGAYKKHEQIAAKAHGKEIVNDWGYKRKVWLPNYFYFVIPTGMIDISEIPEYAGVYEICRTEPREGMISYVYARFVRNAKRLHNEKVGHGENLQQMFLRRLTNIAVDYQYQAQNVE